MILRPFQTAAVNDIREQYRAGHRSVLFQLATGGGKTVTACSMIGGATMRERNTLVVTPRHEIADQFRAALDDMIGPSPRVSVMTAQTVVRRLGQIVPPRLIVIDEAHHATATTWRRIVAEYPDAHILGLTATPERTDGTGLGDIFTAMVCGPEMTWLVNSGYLSPYRLFRPKTRIDTSGLRSRAGDYEIEALAARASESRVVGDAVAEYQRIGNGGTFAVFCVSRAHAAAVAEQFRDAGIETAAIDGTMRASGALREALRDLRSGRLRGVTSCEIISEGFDLPSIRVAIHMRPTQSLIVWLQTVGRALRWEPGKTAIILDHADNVVRHGLPCQPREWSLTGERARRKQESERAVAAIRRCSACLAVYYATEKSCPSCGAVASKGRALIKPTRGVLHEISTDEIKSIADLQRLRVTHGMPLKWLKRQARQRFNLGSADTLRALGYGEGYIRRVQRRGRS